MAYLAHQDFNSSKAAIQFNGQASAAQAMLLLLNDDLDLNSKALALNETFLAAQLEKLQSIQPIAGNIYWLTVARINELALFCAGNYADNGEFRAAGDLLVNPRLILVHFKKQFEPLCKVRHMPLSEQFALDGEFVTETLQRLASQAVLEIEKPPILPLIHQMLKDSGQFCQNYLDSASRRMNQVAEVISLVASWHLPDGANLHQRMQCASKSDRKFVANKLCCFDHEIFWRIGEDIQGFLNNDHYRSNFLVG